MTVVWPLLAGLGLALFLSGLPIWKRSTVARRVEPYMSGYRGRPSLSTRRLPTPRWRQLAVRLVGRKTPDVGLVDRLDAAGSALDAEGFRIEQLALGTGAALAGILLGIGAESLGAAVDLRALPALSLILFAAGWLGRDWLLTRQIERRHAALRDQLPTAIDLMTLSILAGESVPSACGRVAQVLPTGVGREFARVIGDVRAGASTVTALEDLARRVPEVGVGRFVDALCTGIEKGAPLADTLRAQADDGREARRRYLLEVGGRREVLMLVPVVFLIMPVVVVFALYPGLVTLELLVP